MDVMWWLCYVALDSIAVNDAQHNNCLFAMKDFALTTMLIIGSHDVFHFAFHLYHSVFHIKWTHIEFNKLFEMPMVRLDRNFAEVQWLVG